MKEYSKDESVNTMETILFAYISLEKLNNMSMTEAFAYFDLICCQNDINILINENAMVGSLKEIKKCKRILQNSIIYN